MSFLCYLGGYILVSEKGYSFYLCIDFSALFFWSSHVFSFYKNAKAVFK